MTDNDTETENDDWTQVAKLTGDGSTAAIYAGVEFRIVRDGDEAELLARDDSGED